MAARAARSAARASPAADSASCTSRSGTIFSAASPRLRSSAASASVSRALADRYSARSRAKFRARQLGQRLAAADGIAGIDQQSRDARRHRRADLGVGALIDRQLAEQHDVLSARAAIRPRRVVIRRSRSMPSSTSTVLGSSLCGGSAAVGSLPRAGCRGLVGAAAARGQRDARNEDDESS